MIWIKYFNWKDMYQHAFMLKETLIYSVPLKIL